MYEIIDSRIWLCAETSNSSLLRIFLEDEHFTGNREEYKTTEVIPVIQRRIEKLQKIIEIAQMEAISTSPAMNNMLEKLKQRQLAKEQWQAKSGKWGVL